MTSVLETGISPAINPIEGAMLAQPEVAEVAKTPKEAFISSVHQAFEQATDEADRARLTDLVDQELTAMLEEAETAREADRIRGTADYIKWQLFPAPGAPPPENVHLYAYNNGGDTVVGLALDPKTQLTIADADKVARKLAARKVDGRTLQHIFRDRRPDYEDRELYLSARRLLESTPVGMFIRSFAAETPSIGERRLTPFEQIAEAARSERNIRRLRGLPDNIDFRQDFVANKERGRSFFRLDELTKPVKNIDQADVDPHERLSRSIDSIVGDFMKRITGNDVIGIKHAEEGFPNFEFILGDDPDDSRGRELSSAYSVGTQITIALSRHFGLKPTYRHDILDDLQARMLDSMLWADVDGYGQDYDSWIENMFTTLALDLSKEAIGSFGLPQAYGTYLYEVTDTVAWLNGMSFDDVEFWKQDSLADSAERGAASAAGAGVASDSGAGRNREYAAEHLKPEEQADIISEAEMKRTMRRSFAWSRRSLKTWGDNEDRLITMRPLSSELPRYVSDSDLKLKLNKRVTPLDGEVPYIRGYILVADNGKGLYQYVHLPEDDSYTAEGKPFTPRQITRLTAAYREIGMDKLADKLGDPNQFRLTPRALEKLAKKFTDYTFDTSVEVNNDCYELGDFAGQIVKGRLQSQCTGSAQFLRLSLDLMLGRGSATMIEGLVLPGAQTGRRVNQVGHAQVSLLQDGRSIVLDSTGSRSLALWGAGSLGASFKESWQAMRAKLSMMRAGRLANRGAGIAVQESSGTVANDEEQIMLQEFREQLAAERVPHFSETKQRIETQVGALLGADSRKGRQRVYTVAQSLSIGDPLRRTLTILHDDIAPEAILAQKESLMTYANSDPAKVRALRLRQYDPQIIVDLARLTDELARSRR